MAAMVGEVCGARKLPRCPSGLPPEAPTAPPPLLRALR